MDKITSKTMRKFNQKQVFNLIYKEKQISRQQIAEQLKLSLPTVTQDLKLLEEARLIERNGLFQSTGGRKSVAYSCVSNTRVAIGAQITEHSVRMVVVDIYGNIIKRRQLNMEYIHDEAYYRTFGENINAFAKSLNLSPKRILGVGIAVMALLSRDRQAVVKNVLLGGTTATLTDFSRWIDYPCQLFHDSEAAANAELWFRPEISDAVYLGLNYHLNGMLIMNGKIHAGKEYMGGLIEHLTLYPDGRPCYCGKKGCFTAYCSGKLLYEDSEQGCRDFFEQLRAGERETVNRWEEYLSNLAIAIGSLYAVLDCDIILGGIMGSYLTEGDILQLQQMVRNQSLYAPVSDFISRGHSDIDICSCGASLYYILNFLESL